MSMGSRARGERSGLRPGVRGTATWREWWAARRAGANARAVALLLCPLLSPSLAAASMRALREYARCGVSPLCVCCVACALRMWCLCCTDSLRTTPPCLEDEEPLPAAGSGRVPSDKVKALADQICELTMLEVSDLTTLLKDTLNIPDAAMPMGVPMGMPMGVPAAGGAAAEEEEEEEEEKTEFDVKLEAYVCQLVVPRAVGDAVHYL